MFLIFMEPYSAAGAKRRKRRNLPYTGDLDDLLREVVLSVPEISAIAIINQEGLPIASVLPRGIDETADTDSR